MKSALAKSALIDQLEGKAEPTFQRSLAATPAPNDPNAEAAFAAQVAKFRQLPAQRSAKAKLIIDDALEQAASESPEAAVNFAQQTLARTRQTLGLRGFLGNKVLGEKIFEWGLDADSALGIGPKGNMRAARELSRETLQLESDRPQTFGGDRRALDEVIAELKALRSEYSALANRDLRVTITHGGDEAHGYVSPATRAGQH